MTAVLDEKVSAAMLANVPSAGVERTRILPRRSNFSPRMRPPTLPARAGRERRNVHGRIGPAPWIAAGSVMPFLRSGIPRPAYLGCGAGVA